MVFFGNQFSLHVCSNFKMRAGSTGFKAMLEGGKPCAYKSFSVVLNKTMIHQWAEHSLTIEAAESDFMSSINGLVQAEHEKVELEISFFFFFSQILAVNFMKMSPFGSPRVQQTQTEQLRCKARPIFVLNSSL